MFAAWFLVIYCHILNGNNWSSLETCQKILRWANVHEDLNMLTQMVTNYVTWSSSIYLTWNICQIESSPYPSHILCAKNACPLGDLNLRPSAPQTGVSNPRVSLPRTPSWTFGISDRDAWGWEYMTWDCKGKGVNGKQKLWVTSLGHATQKAYCHLYDWWQHYFEL
jgi:hypothetical protein